MDINKVEAQIAFVNRDTNTFSIAFPYTVACGHGNLPDGIDCPAVDWTGLDERQERLMDKVLRKYIAPAGVNNLPRLLARLTQIGCEVITKGDQNVAP